MFFRYVTILALLTQGAWSFSKNLDGRLGLGLTFRDFHSTTAMSARYWFTPYLNGSVLLGFNGSDTSSPLILGGKLSRNLLMEENLNLHAGIGMYLAFEKAASGETTGGVQFDALMGTEFFLSGLPNLGLQFEVGFGMSSVPKLSFRTFGGVFAGAGVHYYF